MTNALLLDVRGLAAGYGEVTVLRDVSLAVAEGAVTALIGSNGAGKTTLMRTLSGLLPSSAGTIVLAGEDITAATPRARVERGLALVPEGRLVFPELSVEEHLVVGATVPRAKGEARATKAAMYDLFPRLAERRQQAAGTLSGGEQQMLAIARALMARPRLLLLDEPSLGLAPKAAAALFDTVRAIRQTGVTVFIVEQDVQSTLELADRAYVMETGAVVLEGAGRELLAAPTVRQAYLGL
jgi:branched-chain amino acid transport system ATP-binding protein